MPIDPSTTEPEYLGEAPSGSSKPTRGVRGPILGLAAVGVVGVVGLGGWAAMSFMSGGSQPATAIPANAVGFVSLDLDPSATQKIEAVRILRKFPAIKKEMKISSQDDLRRWFFDQALTDGTCKSVDYDKQIAPWIGERVAMAAVPSDQAGKAPTPVMALQVTDQEAAAKGITTMAKCGGAGKDFGFAFSGDYAVISDSQKRADALASSATRASLADDASFQTWTKRVGDPGIVTAYAAPGALDALVDMQSSIGNELGMMGGVRQQGMLRPQAEMDRMNKQLKDMYKGFKGMAAVVRFKDGAVEAQFAGDSTAKAAGLTWSPKDHTQIADLPAGTAAAFALSLHDGWAKSYLDMMGTMSGQGQTMDEALQQAEAQTGLDLPRDLENLLGSGVSVALDKDLDIKAAAQDPTGIPAGVRISGDPAKIQATVDKVKKALGPEAGSLVVQQGDGVVALGLDQKYVGDLAGKGGLGNDAVFQDVVPDADRAAAAFYLNFDTVESWVSQGMQVDDGTLGPDEQKILDNIAPLRALGISSWVEDDGTQGGLLRLSTD